MALLQVEHLKKRFGKNEAVRDISFTLQKGRCVTLLGPNGAGKTTTLLMLTGLLEPTSGSIKFIDMEQRDIRQHIGYLPQYPAFYNWMSGKEFLEYVGKLSNVNRSELKARVEEMLQLVGLFDVRNRKIGGYSGGMRQRLGIAQALIHRPKLLLLDEPVSALDPIGRREVLEMIKQIKEETTILFSTHVLHDAQEISEDVLIMNKGEIVLQGELKHLMASATHPIVSIEGKTSLQSSIGLFEKLDCVERVECASEKLKVFVRETEQAEHEILRILVENRVPIRRFEIGTTSLEDLFLQVVAQ